jgi:hypothetical protein
MLSSRRRILTIALVAGGLTMLGTGGALAAVDGASALPGSSHPAMVAATGTQANPPQGGEAPGPTHPFCEGGSPFIASPLCPSKWPPS